MIKKLLCLLAISVCIFKTQAQEPPHNMTLLSHVTLAQMNTSAAASLWAYTANNREYALVGTYNGVSIVDITDPVNPSVLFNVPHAQSEWREIKTFSHYAYASNESGNGLLIIDLANLPSSETHQSWDDGGLFSTVHTLFVDENGILYLFGSDVGQGGALMYDLNVSPTSPPLIGQYNGEYIHDGFVRGDTLWAANVYAGHMTVIDVSNMNNPTVMALWNTPDNFTHNSWPTHDDHYLFTTDEVSDSKLTSYDVSDLSNVSELDEAQSNPGSNVIIHNVHLLNDSVAYVAYYRDGIRVFDVSHPSNIIEIGSYDTSPFAGDNFNGCWGVYPFLPSGNIIASDIEQGLFVVHPDLPSACFLVGVVTDSLSGALLNNATISVNTTTNSDLSDLSGNYSTGARDSGLYTIQVSKAGYSTKQYHVFLHSGITVVLNPKLELLVPFSMQGIVVDSTNNQPVANAKLFFTDNLQYNFSATTNSNGQFSISNFYQGNYDIYVGHWGHLTRLISAVTLNSTSVGDTIKLLPGYRDEFALDLGWTVNSTASTGAWVRAEPAGTSQGANQYNPELDIQNDLSDKCYDTGNGGGVASSDDVDNGFTKLTSPTFDLTGYTDPYISYYRWFANGGGSSGSNPNDSLIVNLSNGITSVRVDLQTFNQGGPMFVWNQYQFKVSSLITPTANMQISFYTADQPNSGNLVEAGIDVFNVFDSLNVGTHQTLQLSSALQIAVAPNPFMGSTKIYFNLGNTSDAQLLLRNVLGEIVATETINKPSGFIEVGNQLTSGIYFAEMISDFGNSKVIRLVKSE